MGALEAVGNASRRAVQRRPCPRDPSEASEAPDGPITPSRWADDLASRHYVWVDRPDVRKLAIDALLRLESEGVIKGVNVRQPYDDTTDIVFNRLGGEEFLVMATTKTELVRVVGRRREWDVAPDELEQTIREWPDRFDGARKSEPASRYR